MALKFRTRLNLTFTVLLFLVVFIMAFSQVGILLYDTWTNNWYKGRVLTQLITPNLSYGLAMKDGSDAYLDSMADLYKALDADLERISASPDAPPETVRALRDASERMRRESKGNVRELFEDLASMQEARDRQLAQAVC